MTYGIRAIIKTNPLSESKLQFLSWRVRAGISRQLTWHPFPRECLASPWFFWSAECSIARILGGLPTPSLQLRWLHCGHRWGWQSFDCVHSDLSSSPMAPRSTVAIVHNDISQRYWGFRGLNKPVCTETPQKRSKPDCRLSWSQLRHRERLYLCSQTSASTLYNSKFAPCLGLTGNQALWKLTDCLDDQFTEENGNAQSHKRSAQNIKELRVEPQHQWPFQVK